MKEELVWVDDYNNIVPEERATHLIIRELNDEGELTRETFVTLDPL